jgi:hypothetical protein
MRASAHLAPLALIALLAPSAAVAQALFCTNGNCQMCDASGNNCRPATQCEKKQAACSKKLSKSYAKCSKKPQTLQQCVLRAQEKYNACLRSACPAA